METAIIIGALSSAAAAAGQGYQGYVAGNEQASAANYNASVLREQGNLESASASANMAANIRKTTQQLGTQAAAIGQANVGVGPSQQKVEQQSATNAKMDALNIWYGGELARHQALSAASEQSYEASVDKSNANASLISGSINAGTKIATGAALYGGLKKGVISPGSALMASTGMMPTLGYNPI